MTKLKKRPGKGEAGTSNYIHRKIKTNCVVFKPITVVSEMIPGGLLWKRILFNLICSAKTAGFFSSLNVVESTISS